MASPVGEIVGVNPQGLANAVRGQEWGMEIDGVMYDIEFTGAVSGDGIILVKVKRKSRTSQQRKIKTPKE